LNIPQENWLYVRRDSIVGIERGNKQKMHKNNS
jgi:hypothetical protein